MLGSRRIAFVAFLTPALLFLGALVVYPAIETIRRSLFDASGRQFVGLDNYTLMFSLDRVRLALVNNLIWVLVFPALVTTLGLIYAVLSERIRWQTIFKTLVFLPMAISFLAAGIIWRIVYEQDPNRGMINALVAIPNELVNPIGQYEGARPSIEAMEVGQSEAVSLQVEVGSDGGVALLGFVGIRTTDVPEDAQPAVEPSPEPGSLVGVAWRDFRPGDNEQGVVEEGEVGLPGMPVRLLRDGDVVGEASTAADGSFRIEGVDPGTYGVEVPGRVFQSSWPGISWLGPNLITLAAIIAWTWTWTGFAMVTLAAGLAALPREMLEAARVDGGSEWQVFRRVTVPLLAPVLTVVFITLTINALKVFDIIIGIAPGAVQDDANVIALDMWRTAFTGFGNFGLGSAEAVLLFLLVVPIMAFNIRRFRLQEGRR